MKILQLFLGIGVIILPFILPEYIHYIYDFKADIEMMTELCGPMGGFLFGACMVLLYAVCMTMCICYGIRICEDASEKRMRTSIFSQKE